MEKILISVTRLGPVFFALILLVSCETGTKKNKQGSERVKEFFSVRINGVLWEAKPSKGFNSYHIDYKPLSRQLTLVAEAADGSRMEISFHSIDRIVPGSYPSTENDNGIKSGIFYYPVANRPNEILGSVSFDNPVQENTIQITKVAQTGETACLIEGTFSAVLYALSKADPSPAAKLTEGKFSVIYRPGLINPPL